MIITKKDLSRILTQGLPLRKGDPEKLANLYADEIGKIDSSVYECFRDDLEEHSVRVFVHGREAFNLLFKDDACIFRSSMRIEELVLFKEEIYHMILRMVVHENTRDFKVDNPMKPTKLNKKYDMSITNKDLKNLAANSVLKKYIKPKHFKNKKFKWD